METSLPLFCEEEEEPCRDVNNSLPPGLRSGGGITRAWVTPGAGEGVEKYKQEILSLFVWKSRERVRVQESRVRVPCQEFVRRSPVLSPV